MTCPTPGKRGHPDQAAAERHRIELRRKGGSVDLNTYRCRCGQWHVGHSARKLQKRIRRALRKR